MADRSGVRVGYRIIQIGTNNTIKRSHNEIVHHLHSAVGQASPLTLIYSFCLLRSSLDSAKDDAFINLQSYDWRNEPDLFLTTSLNYLATTVVTQLLQDKFHYYNKPAIPRESADYVYQ